MDLRIFSLLRPEEGLVHAAMAEVRAPVVYFPAAWVENVGTVLASHVRLLRSSPQRYGSALRMACAWAVRSRLPLAAIRQFWRAAYVAAGCRDAGVRHLHAHFAHQPAAVAALVNAFTGIPYSFTAHAKDLYLEPPASIRQRATRATFIATCTSHNVEYLSRILPAGAASKIRLVYHGTDLKAFAARPAGTAHARKRSGNPMILSVGRLVPKKGFSDLIAACALLRDWGVAFDCTIVGEGPLRGALVQQIQRLHLADRVYIAGAMAHEQLVSLYRDAQVFALAPQVTENGDRDGIPNVLVEAMAAGVPVVTTNVSGIPELVEHERNGLLVEPRQPEELAAAIRRIFQDSMAASLMAQAAACKVIADFDCWKNVHDFAVLIGHETPRKPFASSISA